MAHDRQHGVADGEDHLPGMDGTLVGTEGGAIVQKSFSPSAVGNAIVQRRGTGHVDVPLTPTLDEQAASKKYVDDNSGGDVAGRFFDGYDNAGGTTLSGWTDVPLDTERKKTSDFLHTVPNAEVECDNDGTYIIVGRTSVDLSAGGRADSQVRLALDTGGGYLPLAGLGFIYNRNASQGVGTSMVIAILDLNDGDKIKLQASPRSGSGTYVLAAQGSSLVIFSSKGPKGDKGDTGSGSNITLEDDGVPVPNTPHSTLNFTGDGVSVSDAGGGEAAINIPTPIFGLEFQDEESLGESQTTTEFPSYAQKLRLTTPSVPAGRYRIGWSFEWLGENISDYFYTRVQLDDSTDLMNMKWEPKDNENWHPLGGFAYADLSAVSHTIDLDYACQSSIDPIHIRKARLEIWRVS